MIYVSHLYNSDEGRMKERQNQLRVVLTLPWIFNNKRTFEYSTENYIVFLNFYTFNCQCPPIQNEKFLIPVHNICFVYNTNKKITMFELKAQGSCHKLN